MLATIPSPPLQQLAIGPLTVHVYGVAIAVGVGLALVVLERRHRDLGGDAELANRVALWVLVAGFLGARLGYVLPRVGRFADDPWSVFAIWEGGLALFGGITAGTVTAIVPVRRLGGDLPTFADSIAPAIPLAQAVGRWGNYFNQELYGRPTSLPWALEVEPARRVAPYEQFATFHPTFLYESLWNLALAAALVAIGRTARLRRGTLIFLYAAGYGIARFALELVRVDTTWRLLGLSRNGWIALALVGTVGAVVHHRRGLLPTRPRDRGAAVTRGRSGPGATTVHHDPTSVAPGPVRRGR